MFGLKRFADWSRRLCMLALVMLLGVSIHDNAALAGGKAASNPEIMRLQRQIAANRAFEVKYSCAMRSSFACREIAKRIAQTSVRLASLSVAPRQSDQQQSAVARNLQAKRQMSARISARTMAAAYSLPRSKAKIETRCVRLSDGYYFPTPNSGYNTADDMQAIAGQCKFICDDPSMDVFRMTGTDRNTDEMVSVTTGLRYADLPNAGAYRAVSPLKTCDMAKFYKTVLARTPVASGETTEISGTATEETAEAAIDMVLLGDVGLRGSASFVPAPVRKIRIVGAAYLPVN
ncbi:MAG TPA: DUF2865 domain-containing protein [Pararhizobium sp.]|uniref:DUF2865 domain-containing protein n=1 Tax=Pararhizobium sp. TaxID=1977563 RepID=UPI002CFAAE9E|nr:DUF2865 domain-containing protein [Pararhizobium sp.]HTO31902.1 DUF2865 domain-containing protein [Pararhizobium sp.]